MFHIQGFFLFIVNAMELNNTHYTFKLVQSL